jgi:hypothetical protein
LLLAGPTSCSSGTWRDRKGDIWDCCSDARSCGSRAETGGSVTGVVLSASTVSRRHVVHHALLLCSTVGLAALLLPVCVDGMGLAWLQWLWSRCGPTCLTLKLVFPVSFSRCVFCSTNTFCSSPAAPVCRWP